MNGKWKKIIWVIVILQLWILHIRMIYALDKIEYFAYRAAAHLGALEPLAYHYKELAVAGWLFIAVILLLFQCIQYFKFRNACFQSMEQVEEQEVKEQFRSIYEQKVSKHGMWPLYRNKEIFTPFVIGFRKPVLMIPKKKDNKASLTFIFEHECQHMKVHDNRYKLFLVISQCLLWYQPLVYLVKCAAIQDIEVACDEAVVTGKSMEERYAYGKLLIENLSHYPKKHTANWSSYFYNGKNVIKARINAVMKEKKRKNYAAWLLAFFLLAETILLFGSLINRMEEQRQEAQAAENIYEGCEPVDSFSQAALEKMLSVSEKQEGEGGIRPFNSDMEAFEASTSEAVGPWQIKTRFMPVEKLLTRYFYYYTDQEAGSQWDPEYGAARVEIPYEFILTESNTEAVYYCIVRQYCDSGYGNIPGQEEIKSTISHQTDGDYAYYCLAVMIRQTDDFVYELEAVEDGAEVLTAFREKYPEKDFSGVAVPKLIGTETEREEAKYRIQNEELEISWDDGTSWEEVPVYTDELLERGDEMDGVLSSVQEKSAQADSRKIIFAYGGSTSVPVQVIYQEENGEWKKQTVTRDYYSVRRLFVSFPEDEKTGYLVLTTDRVVWQEGSVLFRTEDGGATWTEVGMAGPDYLTAGHSLTTGAEFVTNEVGFVTIRDSKKPEIWRTEDGGKIWEQVSLPEVPEDYCMAYPPAWSAEGELELFVGMEDYTQYGGEKAYYTSKDLGKTWSYQGIVIRK